jgi:hypothetical protein
MTTIALFGAAGKMGTRTAAKLAESAEYHVLHVEASPRTEAVLRERGIEPAPAAVAAREADVVVLAIPDAYIGRVAQDIVPQMKAGALLVCLDPAAPVGGELPARDDVAYFCTHPCHPPLIKHEEDPAAQADFFGGVARQHIVCALIQGGERDYALGEAIARAMFAPVMTAHRITVEQMALLEPALTETVVLTCLSVVREALDAVIAKGVPAAAARDFLLGHMGVNVGMFFGFYEVEISDGAKLAMARGREALFNPAWKQAFEWDNVLAQVQAIVGAGKD